MFTNVTLSEWSESDAGLGVGMGGGGGAGAGVGVVLGGAARGWLPDVACVLWRRMLAALGDPNALRDPHAHHHLFNYLVHLNATLVKVSDRGELVYSIVVGSRNFNYQ